MSRELSGLRLVTLHNFYGSTHDQSARDLFAGIADLRAKGYGPEYPPNFLPLDSADFVSTHHLICVEEDHRLVPVAGYRTVPAEVLYYYRLALPQLATAQDSSAIGHVRAIEFLQEQHAREDRTLVAANYMTIRKEFRKNESVRRLIKDYLSATMYEETAVLRNASMILAGTLRFKTETLFVKLGYRPLEANGSALGPYPKRSAGGELILPMFSRELSAHARDCYEEMKTTLSQRVVVGSSLELLGLSEKKAA